MVALHVHISMRVCVSERVCVGVEMWSEEGRERGENKLGGKLQLS